jgi:hypothetical protein
MGDADPQIAREQSPTSLRALFGISRDQNAVMGSSDIETADIQIASLFASSPPFPTSDLPSDYSTDGLAITTGSLPSLSDSLNSSQRRRMHHSLYGHSPAGSSPITEGGTSRRSSFKAREIPPSHVSPTIVPRTTRAADLRAGVILPRYERESRPRTPPTKEALKKVFANVPGHKRTESIAVASTAPPSMAPRMTRAASLRITGATPPKPVRPKPIITVAEAKAKAAEEARAAAALKKAQAKTFEGVPGHKRRESFSVASTAPPVLAPRQNRSALLRASKDAAPPSSYQCTSPLPSPLEFLVFLYSAPTKTLFFFFLKSQITSLRVTSVHAEFCHLFESPCVGAGRPEVPASLVLSNVGCWRCHFFSA